MSRKTVFNIDWIDPNLHPQWVRWLQQIPGNPYKARCKLCMKDFELSNMGQQAVISHTKSVGHKKKMCAADDKQSVMSAYLKPREDPSPGLATNSAAPLPAPASRAISQFVLHDEVTRAEILWAMKAVMGHFSFRSSSDIGDTLKAMFPDSEIAKKFSLGKTKLSYLVIYGLAPYFEEKLLNQVTKQTKYVICFDESLNNITKREQMDLCIRFWDETENAVSSRFLTSVFLGHTTAKDLLTEFKKGISPLQLSQLLQVSMDGPNVNWKFFADLESDYTIETEKIILNCGSCGLHVIHGAFRTGHSATGWNIHGILLSLYKLFKDSPARRADYTSSTGSTKFPKKFCQCRWVENAEVARRALEILPNVKKYVTEFKNSLPKYLETTVLTKSLEDSLTLAKLAFFESTANEIEPFLRKFQSDAPLLPFLADECETLLRSLMKRCVRSEVLSEATSVLKLLKVNMSENDNLLSYNRVDIGFAAEKFLTTNHKITQKDKIEFRMDVRAFLLATCLKIIERSPLKYSIVRSLGCLNPSRIVSQPKEASEMMTNVLKEFYDKNHISSQEAENVKKEFSKLCTEAQTTMKEQFLEFVRNLWISECKRLDAFYYRVLSSNEKYRSLFEFIKVVLILSHGNATVERGFSINSEILIENLQESSLVGLRTVYDAVRAAGGHLNVDINASLLRHVRASWKRYNEALKLKKTTEEKSGQKKRAADEIKIIEAKKTKIQEEHNARMQSLDMELHKLKSKHV